MFAPTFGGRVVPTRLPRPLPFLTLVVLLTIGVSSALIQATIVRPSVPLAAPPALNQLPLAFVPNAGQTDLAVRFQAQVPGASLFFTPSEVVLALAGAQAPPDPAAPAELAAVPDHSPPRRRATQPDLPVPTPPTVVRLQFVGTAAQPHLVGTDQLPGVVNYLRGNDPTRWRTGLPTYAGLSYGHLYPGIDLHYTGQDGQLKGTYIVAPGADPRRIRWRYEGAHAVTINQTGALEIDVGGDSAPLREDAPIAWQERDGQHEPVAVRYHLADNGEVGFAVGGYDARRPLILDPLLSYSTFLGGNGHERGWSIAVDDRGQAYITGYTDSADFPLAHALDSGLGGDLDAFVSALNSQGTALRYSTYLGGSGTDTGLGIAVDQTGQAYVTGATSSEDFPTVNAFDASFNGVQFNAFVSALNSQGTALRYSTYLGGSGTDRGTGIAVDQTGQAYVTGMTYNSEDFPTVNAFDASFNGAWDTFVSALNSQGTALRYSTYLGGSRSDRGAGIAVDAAGQAYVTGETVSEDFPTVNALDTSYSGNYDTFVSALNNQGTALRYSTYLGGSNDDRGMRIAVDGAGSAYVTGGTSSADFPTVNARDATLSGSDAFVSALNSQGTSLRYSTFLGGNSYDEGVDIAVDGAGQAYVTGVTGSENFPTANALDATYNGGGFDAFVSKLDARGAIVLYSTYLGGSAADFILGIAVDAAGQAYVTGETLSEDFPLAQAFDASFDGDIEAEVGDAFVTKIADASSLAATLYALSSTNELLRFTSDAPGRLLAQTPITGLPATEQLRGIEVHPTTGLLYAVGASSRLYRLDPDTGRATAVGIQPFTPSLAGTLLGIDVDPASDELRLIGPSGNQRRLDLNSGAVLAVGPTLRYATWDPNAGRTLVIDGAAFPPGGGPTWYIIDSGTDVLAVVQDDTLHTIGPLGIGVEPRLGFDIAPGGTAYAAPRADDGISGAVLVEVNLQTGQLRSIGRIGRGVEVWGLAVAGP